MNFRGPISLKYVVLHFSKAANNGTVASVQFQVVTEVKNLSYTNMNIINQTQLITLNYAL